MGSQQFHILAVILSSGAVAEVSTQDAQATDNSESRSAVDKVRCCLRNEQGEQILAMPTAVNYALTAYAGEMNAKQVVTAGFNKHLAKPVELAELVDAIANLIAE